MLEAGNILSFLAGDEYLPAIPVMVIIMPTILLIGLSNITGMQILVPLSLERYTIVSTIVGAVVDLVLNTILIPQFGALGAAIGAFVAEASVLLVQIYFLRRSPYIHVLSKDFIKIIISVIFTTGLLIIVNVFFTMNNSFLDLLWSSILYFGVYGALLFFMKEEMVQKYGGDFLGKILKRH